VGATLDHAPLIFFMKKSVPIIIVFLYCAQAISLMAQKPEDRFHASKLPFYRYAELFSARDSTQAYELFRHESIMRLNDNERIIDGFLVELNKKKRRIRTQYFLVVTQLEKKNAELKKRIVEYKPGGQLTWSVFRRDFSQEIDQLANSLVDLKIEDQPKGNDL
jgi:hypothetical protein